MRLAVTGWVRILHAEGGQLLHHSRVAFQFLIFVISIVLSGRFEVVCVAFLFVESIRLPTILLLDFESLKP